MIPRTPDPLPCQGRAKLFDSTWPTDHQAAKKLCATCPIIHACRQHLQAVTAAMTCGERPVGTWAGLLLTQGTKRSREPVDNCLPERRHADHPEHMEQDGIVA